jgi:hypothetical protein
MAWDGMAWDGMGWRGENFCLEVWEERKGKERVFSSGTGQVNDLPTNLRRIDRSRRIQYRSD